MSKTEWFHLIGLVSVITLGIGFVTAFISLCLSWQINLEQKATSERVNLELETQRERTAIAEAELLKLHERVKPRSLDEEKRKVLLELLKSNPKGRAEIICLAGTSDACSFATQLREVLIESGWSVKEDVFEVLNTRETPKGIALRVPSLNPEATLSMSLKDALKTVGFAVESIEHPMPETLDLAIFVGAKP